jgi:hypothetical protein
MRRKAVLLLMLVAALVMVGGTALAVTYTTSKRVSLKLNKPNYVGTALTRLASNAVGPALTLETDSQNPSATPLKLDTETPSQPPMSVDSSTKVTDLNADQLDGKSDTDFASSTHNHDSRYFTETEVSNGFIQGRGTAQHRALALNPGQNLFFWEMGNPPLSLSYNCPGPNASNLTSNGFVGIKNTGTEVLNAFSDNGSGNPTYNQLDPVGSQSHPTGEFWSQGAAAGGEYITFQVHSTSFVATIEVFSVHRTSALNTGTEDNCHVQAQALVTRP